MSYFTRFPFIRNYKIQGKTYTGMDITRRTSIVNRDSLSASAYIAYTINEGETPIILADRLYDDKDLYWVILLFNDIFDIEADWPLDQVSLDTYVNRIYDDPYGIHHYEAISTGAWIDTSTYPSYDTIPVTNYEYEIALNDAKREIKLPHPNYVGTIVTQHNRLIQI